MNIKSFACRDSLKLNTCTNVTFSLRSVSVAKICFFVYLIFLRLSHQQVTDRIIIRLSSLHFHSHAYFPYTSYYD